MANVQQTPDTLLDAVEALVEELDREQGSGLISYKALVKLGALRRLLHEARAKPERRLLMRDVVAVTGERVFVRGEGEYGPTGE